MGFLDLRQESGDSDQESKESGSGKWVIWIRKVSIPDQDSGVSRSRSGKWSFPDQESECTGL